MSLPRRHFIGLGGIGLLGSALGGLASRAAGAADYRALVVIHLNGGNDGNNSLVPLDGGYRDYQLARQNLALAQDSLVALGGSVDGRRYGLHPALRPLAALYEQKRLGFIANVGVLSEPSTAAKVLAGQVQVPPFLFSHSDQTAIVQGWTVSEDNSGWAGRALELLPSELRGRLLAVTSDTNRTLVLGRQSGVSFLDRNGGSWWGIGDLARPQELGVQSLARMAQWQFGNAYEAEFARTYGAGFADAVFVAQCRALAVPPTADFGGSEGIAASLSNLASLLPVFRSKGLRRQVFLQSWGGFDTHAGQRGTGTLSQDTQLDQLAKALAAFDASNRANGLDDNVLTLVMSEFGRTLRPGSGGGSEHAWGNHWWLIGGPTAGGTVVGRFPALVLGGPDDGDSGKNGRWVPGLSSDQVGATLMQWLGLPASAFVEVFPALARFASPTLPLLSA
ncbi:MAG: DUF1501 domain-containing protein [Inhella sp.]